MNQRLVYRNAFRSMVKAGVNPGQAILSQSYLRLERQISTTTTSYQFGVLVNDQPAGQGAVRPTEQRLNLQDSFFVSSVQIFTSTTASASTTNFSLDSYPNPRKYSGTTSATDLYNLYNGYLSLTVNNRVITPSWDIQKHLSIPQTQQTATPIASTVPLDQFEGSMSGAFPVEPNWVLIGSKNNNLTLNLPAAISAVTNTEFIVILLRGVLAQNSTIVS